MDGLAKLIEALAQVLKAVAWPGVIAFALYRLGTSLGTFLENIGEAKFKGLGVEASTKRKTDIASKAATAINRKNRVDRSVVQPAAEEKVLQDAISVANNATTPEAIRTINGKSVLWVDDHPDNNSSEIETLRSMGLKVDTAITTKEGLEKYDFGSFDVVVTDLSRENDDRAGFDLVGKLIHRPIRPPVIIYCSSISNSLRKDAQNAGAYGITDRPEDLFALVLRALNIPNIFR